MNTQASSSNINTSETSEFEQSDISPITIPQTIKKGRPERKGWQDFVSINKKEPRGAIESVAKALNHAKMKNPKIKSYNFHSGEFHTSKTDKTETEQIVSARVFRDFSGNSSKQIASLHIRRDGKYSIKGTARDAKPVLYDPYDGEATKAEEEATATEVEEEATEGGTEITEGET